MISEEMLKIAAAEADQAIRDSLPAPAECAHEFSPSFQRKMRRTVRKAKHSVIYKLPKCAACLVLVAALASGSWLTVDAEARDAFFAWAREQYASFMEYRFWGNTGQELGDVSYEITSLPEGFYESNRMDSDGIGDIVYQDASGNMIQFSYSHGDDSLSLFVEHIASEVQTVCVNGRDAELYLSTDSNTANVLLWKSEDDRVLFYIAANLPGETMIALAESVQKK
ncbi:MAG TPA: DUF4367 domain-containing protein [Candidatus Avoscillospira stercorigallinarum]|uniref:DUF4367 domain-containing protein n=1 Tax=Candidatus Avoscillospira stercorigallinarum TaxID=2840708 RepID=A0A9D1CMJ8_9FIRM|nr:DUF4367 domain-containing protein [Candidatus Avoscillospira stercorigallinarum]